MTWDANGSPVDGDILRREQSRRGVLHLVERDEPEPQPVSEHATESVGVFSWPA